MVIIKILQEDEALVQNIKTSHEKQCKEQPTWYDSASVSLLLHLSSLSCEHAYNCDPDILA